MPNPICYKCETEFRRELSGVLVIETFGKDQQPYKLWLADFWECQSCHIQIVFGFGDRPLANHFDAKFDEILKHEKERAPKVIYDRERRGCMLTALRRGHGPIS